MDQSTVIQGPLILLLDLVATVNQALITDKRDTELLAIRPC